MLSVPEAAARLGVHPTRINFLITAGRIKAIRVGKVWAIREADLAKWKPLPPYRPRKHPEGTEPPKPPRKKMGRPRIHPPKDPNAPKRPRGRPRKIQPDTINPE